MKDSVVDILAVEGPCLSSRVIDRLVAEERLSSAAARKRIARALKAGAIRRVDLSFAKNASFLHLARDYGSDRFWAGLARALGEGSYGRAIAALEARGGILPITHFSIACGAPLEQERQVTTNQIRAGLSAANLTEELEVPGVGTCIAFAKGSTFLAGPIEHMKARLITEKVLLSAVKEWARNLGFGSYDSFRLRSDAELPRVGPFLWDMTAPSYVGGLASPDGKQVKPGFVVFDLVLGAEMTERGMSPFIHKCKTLRRFAKMGRCMQFFIAERYTREAFKLAKAQGIVPATPRALFGEEVAEALRELMATLANAAKAAVDPAKFDLLFDKLGKIEGAANSLRGALFEFIAAELGRRSFLGNVEMNREFREGGMKVAEVDVLIHEPKRSIRFIECKGNLPGRLVSDEEVEAWLHKRIPAVRRHALAHPEWKNLTMVFELWTTGDLSAHAEAMIAAARTSITKYEITVRRTDDLDALALQTKDDSLINVLRKHFIRHPLADWGGPKASPAWALSSPTIAALSPPSGSAASTSVLLVGSGSVIPTTDLPEDTPQ